GRSGGPAISRPQANLGATPAYVRFLGRLALESSAQRARESLVKAVFKPSWTALTCSGFQVFSSSRMNEVLSTRLSKRAIGRWYERPRVETVTVPGLVEASSSQVMSSVPYSLSMTSIGTPWWRIDPGSFGSVRASFFRRDSSGVTHT